MRWPRVTLDAVPPAVALPALVVLQLVTAALLGRGQGWHHSAGSVAVAGCLLAVEIALFYLVAELVGGRAFALCAGLLFVAIPVVLTGFYFGSGGGTPLIHYRTVYRHDILPTTFGLTAKSGLVAACLLLASGWLSLARTRAPLWATAALAGAAASGAALAYPRAWPALAAPVLAALAARRPASIVAPAATAGAGLLALALFRHVPHIPFGWHHAGLTLGQLREFTWSRRVLEYLPLAGLIGLARRSTQATAFFGTLLVAVVILPLARSQSHQLTPYLLGIVPGLPAYVFLAASVGFLVPRGRAEAPATTMAADQAT